MTHWKTQIEKDFLGAWDLYGPDGKPRDATLEIAKVGGEKLKTKQQPKGKGKLVIRFTRTEKAFVCNKTNGEIIERMYGPEIEGWVGKRITLYPELVRNPDGGENIPGIRVRPRPPQGRAEPGPNRPVDEKMRAAQNAAFGRENEQAQGEPREPGAEG